MEILSGYKLGHNETVKCIENDPNLSYNIYAIYVNGLYERRIRVVKDVNFTR